VNIAHALFTFAFTPDGRQMVLRNRAFATILWDIDTMAVLGAPMRSAQEIDAGEVFGAGMSSSELQESNDRDFVGLAISPDGKIIATATRMVSFVSGKTRSREAGPPLPVRRPEQDTFRVDALLRCCNVSPHLSQSP
jgi:hypothetical protein